MTLLVDKRGVHALTVATQEVAPIYEQLKIQLSFDPMDPGPDTDDPQPWEWDDDEGYDRSYEALQQMQAANQRAMGLLGVVAAAQGWCAPPVDAATTVLPTIEENTNAGEQEAADAGGSGADLRRGSEDGDEVGGQWQAAFDPYPGRSPSFLRRGYRAAFHRLFGAGGSDAAAGVD